MNTYKRYEKIKKDLYRSKFPEPFWAGRPDSALNELGPFTPREVKALVRAHGNVRYPLRWIADAIHGVIPDSWEGYEAATERNMRDYHAFVKGMAKLMRRHKIAPKWWIKWWANRQFD